ncbi:hypothetical protein M9X92_010474 [Pyricularia oryzae]|nr:hypothetical protein M9X92_010474 [Pyricularia oryzae]
MDRLEGTQAAPGTFTRLALPNKTDERPYNKEIVAALWFLSAKFCSRLGWFRTKHNAVHCFPTASSEERRLALGTSTRMPDFGSFRRATKSGVFANAKTLVGHISLIQKLDQSREKIVATIHHLQNLLSSTMSNEGPERDEQRLRVQEDIHASKQCLEVCKQASKQFSRQKIHIVGEVVADDDTDQVVVTTLADLFDVGKVLAKSGSAQLIGIAVVLAPHPTILAVHKFAALPCQQVVRAKTATTILHTYRTRTDNPQMRI